MNNEPWSLDLFTRWLTEKVEELHQQNFIIELHHNQEPRASTRLRVETKQKVGELTVWDDGSAYEAVLDLKSGDFIHEKDGFDFKAQWKEQFYSFLELTAESSKVS